MGIFEKQFLNAYIWRELSGQISLLFTSRLPIFDLLWDSLFVSSRGC